MYFNDNKINRWILIFLLLIAGGAARAQAGVHIINKIDCYVAKSQYARTYSERGMAARNIALLTQNVRGENISKEIVKRIIPLLDSKDDAVRAWTASALADLGPSAKIAIPKLLEILPKGECQKSPFGSGGRIRYALYRLGVRHQPPQSNCLNR